MRYAQEEMDNAAFDPFSDEGRRITFLFSDARDQLAAFEAKQIIVDPATLGRGTGEVMGHRFDLD